MNIQVQRYNFFPMIQRKVSKKLKTKAKIDAKKNANSRKMLIFALKSV